MARKFTYRTAPEIVSAELCTDKLRASIFVEITGKDAIVRLGREDSGYFQYFGPSDLREAASFFNELADNLEAAQG